MEQDKAKALRDKANQILKQKSKEQKEYKSEDLEQLIEELSIHQIELELQNQELSEQQTELKAAKDKYFNLYNLAPVAYLTLSSSMDILEANRHAHELFEFIQGSLIGRRITEFIHPEWQDNFYLYIREIKKKGIQTSLEIKLNDKLTKGDIYLYIESKPLIEDGEDNFLISLINITSRKKAEQQLAERNKQVDAQNQELRQMTNRLSQSEENHVTLIEAIPSPIIYKNSRGSILGGNTAAYKFFGLDATAIKGKTVNDILDASNASFIQQKDKEVLAGETRQSFELQLHNANNQLREFVVHRNTYNVSGEQGIVELFSDATEERRIRRELTESENKFRTLFEQAGDISFILDKEGRIINTNVLFTKKLGYSTHELSSYTIGDICQKEIIDDTHNFQETLKEEGSMTTESQLTAKNGEQLPVEIRLGPIEIANEINYLAIARDISERRKAEKALAASEQKFRNFFQQSYEGIALMDKSGRIVEWNKASENLTGIPTEEATKKYAWEISTLVHPQFIEKSPLSDINKYIKELLQGKRKEFINRKINAEIVNQKTKEKKYLSLALFSIEYEEGYFTGAISYDETARINAERKLTQNERFFRNLSENMSDLVAILDDKGRYKWASPSHAKILAYEPQKLINTNSFDLIHPKDKDYIANAFFNNKKQVDPLHYRIKHKNGTYRWLEGTGKILTETNSSDEYAIINARDITKRKEATVSLKQNENLLNKVIENATVGIRLIDTDKNIIKANKLYAHWHGKEVKDIINKKCCDFLHYGYGENDRCKKLFQVIDEHDYLEQKIFRKMGNESKYFIYNAVSFKDEEQNLNGVLEVFKDITDLETARRNADRLLKRLNMAIEVGNLGWWEWNINTGAVEFADKKITMLGYKKNEIKPDINGFIELIHPDDKPAAITSMRKHLRGEAEAYTIEYRLQGKDGEYRWFYDQGKITAWNEDGSPSRMIGVIYSIADTVRQREQLKTAKLKAEESNRTKSEFLANMSHEIRTPLNSVLGFAEILKSELGAKSQYAHYLDGINSSAKNLLNLINDILDVSKIEAGKLQINKSPVNVKAMLQEMEQVFSIKTAKKGIDLNIDLDRNMPGKIRTDAVRLRQILFNLIGNAVKFTDKGRVLVSASAKPSEGNSSFINITIKVKDTGTGIPKEQQEIIFEPFRQQENSVQVQKGGTGLGLTITKRLVEMLNGTIWLNSEPGKGSEFIFTLYKQEALNDEEEEYLDKPIKQVLFEKQTILIIEDDYNNREVIKGLLQNKNLKFEEATNGKQGIEKAKALLPDMVLMDILMPEMDGIQATQEIKKLPGMHEIPVIAITAATVQEKIDKIMKYADGVLYKPVSSIELTQKLSQWLESSTLEKSPQKTHASVNFGEKFATMVKDETQFTKAMKQDLKERVLPVFETANRSYSLSKIEEFANAIEQYSSYWQQDLILEYAKELKLRTDQFKFENIMQLLDDFSLVANVVKNNQN